MEKQTTDRNNGEYRSLAEKVIENPALRKGLNTSLKGISWFAKDFFLSFDDIVSSAYRAPTQIRRFLNKQNYLLRNKESIEENVRIGAIFGFGCGVVPYILLGLWGFGGLTSEFMEDPSFVFAGTNLFSLIYETGRFGQSRKERKVVLGQIQKSKEKEIENQRYDSHSIKKIESDVPKRDLYLIKEFKTIWMPNSPSARETILDSSGKIYSERNYRTISRPKKPRKKK